MPQKCNICEQDIKPDENKVIQVGQGLITSGEFQDFISRGPEKYYHLDCFKKVKFPLPESVTFRAGWEDSEVASIEELICSCGNDLLGPNTEYVVSHEETIDCPKCGKKYQFIWKGMTIQEVK